MFSERRHASGALFGTLKVNHKEAERRVAYLGKKTHSGITQKGKSSSH
jgi:hypothetical protein